MALKNIHDSMTQPGHKSRGSHDKKYQEKLIRRQVHKALRQVDQNDEDLILPTHPPTRREETAKVWLARKWIEKQIGKPWKQVEKQLQKKVGNDRSMRGVWLRKRIMEWISLSDSLYARSHSDFYVDDAGLLQNGWELYKEVDWSLPRKCMNYVELNAWGAERKIGFRQGNAWWFEPTAREQGAFHSYDGEILYYEVVTAYRRGQPLSDEEFTIYEQLRGYQLRQVMLKHQRRHWQRAQTRIIEE